MSYLSGCKTLIPPATGRSEVFDVRAGGDPVTGVE